MTEKSSIRDEHKTQENMDLRLQALERHVAQEQQKRQPKKTSLADGKSLGFRIASDFMSACVVGIILGYQIDKWFDIAPWGMIGLTLLGFVTGVRNAMRTTEQAQRKEKQTPLDKK